MYGASIDDKEPYEKQIIALYERNVKSDNDQVRNKAIYMLAAKYLPRMKYKQAQKTLDLLLERTAFDKTQFQASLNTTSLCHWKMLGKN